MYTNSANLYPYRAKGGEPPLIPPPASGWEKQQQNQKRQRAKTITTRAKSMTKTKEKNDKKKLVAVRNFRLSAEDAEAWDAKVEASGMTASAFFRLAVMENKTVIQGAKKPVAKKNMTVEQKKILFLFAQQSNNINQLAHQVNAAHRAGKITPDLYMAVLEQLQSINQIAKGWVS